MAATQQVDTEAYVGQSRIGTRPLAPAAGYADPFGPPAPRTPGHRKATRRSAGRQRFWGVVILVLFVLGVTAAKWFAQ